MDRLFGLAPGQTARSLDAFIALVHSDDRRGVIERCEVCAQKGADFEMEFRVVPTSANFLYCDVGEDAAGVAEQLRSERVSVRPLGGWGAPSCLRVSIGRPEQNEIFLRAMRRIASTRKIAK